MKKILLVTAIALVVGVMPPSNAQDQKSAPEDPAHQALRQLRDDLVETMNQGDIEASLKFLHTNVVITWHNAEVSSGHDGVRAYHNRVMSGPNKIVESFHCSLTVDGLTLLYGGDTGVCFGSSEEQFKLANGKRLNLKGRWSATLVKDDGRWLVANLHASTNLFDNVLLTVAKKAVWWAGIISLGLGLIVGVVVGRRAGGQPKRSR
jgi:ketosteroid isomerase-like protein